MSPSATFNVARSQIAAKASADLRVERVRQRRELRTLPPQEVVRRLVHPTPELASFRLGVLLAPVNTRERPIPRFGKCHFEKALRLLHLAEQEWADPKIRLRQLNLSQRRQLAGAILRVAPKAWSGRA